MLRVRKEILDAPEQDFVRKAVLNTLPVGGHRLRHIFAGYDVVVSMWIDTSDFKVRVLCLLLVI